MSTSQCTYLLVGDSHQGLQCTETVWTSTLRSLHTATVFLPAPD